MWVFDPFSGTFKFVEMPSTEGTLTPNGTLDFGANSGDISLDTGLRTNDAAIIDSGDRLV
jgi:hypothetical protein